MGLIGATCGYIGGKFLLVSFSLITGMSSISLGALSYVFPKISPYASYTFLTTKKTMLMTISPLDPVSTRMATTIGMFT